MSNREGPSRRRPPSRSLTSERENLRAANFIEELSWLLKSYSDLDVTALRNIRNIVAHQAPRGSEDLTNFAPKNPNIFFLVGVLPSLFINETLFQSNVDIVEFAHETLDLRIPRWQKKSKFEIIGHIVCETTFVNDRRAAKVVKALSLLSEQDEIAFDVKRDRDSGLNWNEIIQKYS